MSVKVIQEMEVEDCIESRCFYADYENGVPVCEHWNKKYRSLEGEDYGIPEDCPFRKRRKSSGKKKTKKAKR